MSKRPRKSVPTTKEPIPPSLTSGRNRWNSSSSDEDENNGNSIVRKKKPTNETKEPFIEPHAHGVVTAASPPRPPPLASSYNPLLQGCRLVYDTYERLDRLDEGTYGIVWKAREIITNTTSGQHDEQQQQQPQIVALKQIKFDVGCDDDDDDTDINQIGGNSSFEKEGFPITALREISVLLALSQQHANIVRLHEIVVGRQLSQVYLVMEYLDRDLKSVLETKKEPFAQGEVKHMLRQVLSGVQHLHSNWYLHRDLKTSNLLVDQRRGRVVVCDLGLARRYQEPRLALTQMVCTLWYRPPELLFGYREYGPEVDMWSLGCIYAELLTRQPLLPGQGELDQTDLIFRLMGVPTSETWPEFERLPNAAIFRWKQNSPPQLSQRFPRLAAAAEAQQQTYLDQLGYSLLSQMLQLNPQRRISATNALQHKYFTQGISPLVPQFDDIGCKSSDHYL